MSSGQLATVKPSLYGQSPLRGVVFVNVPDEERNPDGYLSILTGQSASDAIWVSNLNSAPGFAETDERTNPFEALYGKTAAAVGEDVVLSSMHEITVEMTALTLQMIKLMRPDMRFELKMSGTSAAATLTVGAGNAGFTVTADSQGAGGNSIRIARVAAAGANAPTTVAVSGNDITVTLGTGATAGTPNATASQVVGAINANPAAAALVTAALASGSDGTGLVAAGALTPLAGGSGAPIGVRMTRTLDSGPSTHLENIVIAYSTSTHTIGRDVVLFNPKATTEERNYELSDDLEVFGVKTTFQAFATDDNLDPVSGILLPAFEENDYTTTSIPANLL